MEEEMVSVGALQKERAHFQTGRGTLSLVEQARRSLLSLSMPAQDDISEGFVPTTAEMLCAQFVAGVRAASFQRLVCISDVCKRTCKAIHGIFVLLVFVGS